MILTGHEWEGNVLDFRGRCNFLRVSLEHPQVDASQGHLSGQVLLPSTFQLRSVRARDHTEKTERI